MVDKNLLPSKPPYRIPSMKEIAKKPFNSYKVVSTFSGCGGGCLGLRMAGFKILWANEFIPAAQEAYEANFPDTIMDTRDIRTIKPEEILKAIGMEKGELDLLEGSPPCADFSVAGKREGGQGKIKKYSSTKQRVDDLFFEFARILEGLQPKVFIAENVRGLTMGAMKYLLGSAQLSMFGDHEDTIFYTLLSKGYNVRCKVLNAADYQVPQHRERLIIMGVRKDFDIEPLYPLPLRYTYTVGDAWEGLENKPEDIIPTIVNPSTALYSFMLQMKPGEAMKEYHPRGAGYTCERLSESKLCPTILASQGKGWRLLHPYENRVLTVPELKRLHSYPDDFILNGNFSQNCERIGRSVVPFLYYYIGMRIKYRILDRIASGEKVEASAGISIRTSTETSTEIEPQTGDSIEVIRQEVMNCYKCPRLVASRNKIAFSYGSGSNGIMLIGEAPSQVGGNITGRPMSDSKSRTGALIQEILDECGLKNEECYSTNICFCSPPSNEDPTPEEINNCLLYTIREVELIKPRLVFLLGKVAAQCFLPASHKRNTIYYSGDTRCVALFHPAYVLRQDRGTIEAYKTRFVELLRGTVGTVH